MSLKVWARGPTSPKAEKCRRKKEARPKGKGEAGRYLFAFIINQNDFYSHLWRTVSDFWHVHRKGKKDGKHESKADKESEIEKFKSNAALWEAKFNITEISSVEYREAARALAKANEELENQQYRNEKDTDDIIAFLKRTDREKTATVSLHLSKH